MKYEVIFSPSYLALLSTNQTNQVSENAYLSTHPEANKRNEILNGADVGQPCSFLVTVETNRSPGAGGCYQKNLGKLITPGPTFSSSYL